MSRSLQALIDVNHPAHVHYFGHLLKDPPEPWAFRVTARDKDLTLDLLRAYSVPFLATGKGASTRSGRVFHLLAKTAALIRQVRAHDIRLLLGLNSPYVSLAGRLSRIPSIVFNDTEHARSTNRLVRRWADVYVTPECYRWDEGPHQVRVDTYHELAYASPARFRPDPAIWDELGCCTGTPYVLVRFVSWAADHDKGHTGLTLEEQQSLLSSISEWARVFVSSESRLPPSLQRYALRIRPERIHHAMAFADVIITEGATMASESVCLGTPSIFVNSLPLGYCAELETRYGLLASARSYDECMERLAELRTAAGSRQDWLRRRERMLSEKVDPAAWLRRLLAEISDDQADRLPQAEELRRVAASIAALLQDGTHAPPVLAQ